MIDAHLHLADPRFDADRILVLQQARCAGVTGFLTTATKPENWTKTLALACDEISVFIGTHPWESESHDQDLLEKRLIENPSAGVGEIGLDGVRPCPGQEDVFVRQFSLAAKLHRPAVIHCVKRFDRLKAVIKKTPVLPPAFLVHGFAGTVQDVLFFKNYPCYFSFSGRSQKTDVMRAVPPDRLLAETDSPDQRPADGLCLNPAEKRNVPANLALILPEIAAITGVTEQQITLNTEMFRNAR